MSSELNCLYQELFKYYKLLHTNKSAQQSQQAFNIIWAEAKAKNCANKEELIKFARNLLVEYRQKHSSKKASNILCYFAGTSGSSKKISIEDSRASENKDVADCPVPSTSGTLKRKTQYLENNEEVVDDPSNIESFAVKRVRATPAQDVLMKKISLLEGELYVLIQRRDSISADGKEQAQILKLRKNIGSLKKELHKKQQHSVHVQKYRDSQKSKLMTVCNQNPDVASILKLRSEPGRPRLEDSQPELLKTITELAMFGASAEERRRCEIVRSCRTLADLHTRLVDLGFNISKSGTYIRLLPRRYNTIEGKRHVTTVPVKLSRPEADHHKAHPDQQFCVSTIRSLETVASILGPNQVSFISQDDKARVPIGLSAANKQAPLLMHVEYRVSLPDHDWVVAARHKLIPSVYAGCIIKGDAMGRPEAVTYSGPTYIAIRSGKHSSSTASSHAIDFQKLVALDAFKEIIRNETGNIKPVLMISSDGGPDENPRYPKVVANAIHHFFEYDLDAIFMFTNAPGRSAFNRVERRMAPLSRELSGVILPHDTYGSHLDDRGRTVDSDLEKKNFRKAGEVLAEIWSSVVIDGKDVVAEYVEPNSRDECVVPTMPSQDWCDKHLRQSQYFLQVVKCKDRGCCKEMRSALRLVLPDGFLPIPFPIIQDLNGFIIPKPEEHDGKSFANFLLKQSLALAPSHDRFCELPYDMYCPSLQSKPELLAGRTCKECGLYFCSKKAVAAHKKTHKKKNSASDEKANEEVIVDAESSDQDLDSEQISCNRSNDDTVSIVSIKQSNESPWIDEDDF